MKVLPADRRGRVCDDEAMVLDAADGFALRGEEVESALTCGEEGTLTSSKFAVCCWGSGGEDGAHVCCRECDGHDKAFDEAHFDDN